MQWYRCMVQVYAVVRIWMVPCSLTAQQTSIQSDGQVDFHGLCSWRKPSKHFSTQLVPLSGVCFSLKLAITCSFLHFLFLVLYHKSNDKDSASCCLIPISISFYCDIRILKVKGGSISDKIYCYLFVLFKYMVSNHPNFLLLIRQF